MKTPIKILPLVIPGLSFVSAGFTDDDKQMLKDHIMMTHGEVMMIKEGKSMPLDKEITLSDGTSYGRWHRHDEGRQKDDDEGGRLDDHGRRGDEGGRSLNRVLGLGDLERLAPKQGFIHHAASFNYHAVHRALLYSRNRQPVHRPRADLQSKPKTPDTSSRTCCFLRATAYLGNSFSSFFTRLTSGENCSESCFASAS